MYYGLNHKGQIVKIDAYRIRHYLVYLYIDNDNVIWNVHTHPDYLRKGLMTKLFKFVLSWKRTYTLLVHPDNIPAVNLYTKLGFKFIECDMMEFKP